MARNTMEAWIAEEVGSEVITRVNNGSAVERLGRRIPMNSDVKLEPRSAGVGVAVVAKGGLYTEDESVNDVVTLTARKIGKAIRIAEEDVNDSVADVIKAKQLDWAASYGKFLDNAALGTTAAVNGTTVPFTSVYAELKATLPANTLTTAGAVDYDELSNVLGLVETGDYFDEARVVVIAHPSFRANFRQIKDANGMPIFIQGLQDTPDTLFGHNVAWSTGARTSAVATDAPTGNPLLVVANRDYMLLGARSGPESCYVDGGCGSASLTDESILKLRARRAFAVGHPAAFAILEKTAV